uniref:Uncharacterized protein n=1 Tax=Arundo donax TaxID=35708 RepID=A0A0A8Y5W0_ARUDO
MYALAHTATNVLKRSQSYR